MIFSRGGVCWMTALTLLALSAGASGATLTEIPTWSGYVDLNQTSHFVGQNAQALAISPDGKVIVGQSDGQVNETNDYSIGFVWDETNGVRLAIAGGWSLTTALGVSTRKVNGTPELVVQGLASGYLAYITSADGGLTWEQGYRMMSGFAAVKTGAANTVSSLGVDDLVYGIWWDDTAGDDGLKIDHMTGSPITRVVDGKNVPNGYKTSVQSVSGNGIAVGRRKESNQSEAPYSIYIGQATGTGGGNWGYYAGLQPKPGVANPQWPTDYTNIGEAWAISIDGTQAFGVSPIAADDNTLYPFRLTLTSNAPAKPNAVAIHPLPLYPDVAGSSRGYVYGANYDGTWAVGHNNRGLERAVLWDLRDADPANWKVYDLTAYFGALGQLGNFVRLDRAYSVAVDTTSQEVVVAGRGGTVEGTVRAFVARIPLSAFPLPDTGACCMIGSCTSKFAADCPNIEGQQSWTANTLCINASCPGACCHADGTCSDFVAADACVGEGDIARGASTSCATACLGACCNGQNTCVQENYGVCPEADFKGIGTDCANEACPCSSTYHVWADRDMDGDVDQEDFGLFQECFTGEAPGVAPGCECFDHVNPGSGVIDEFDLNAFEDCATGPAVVGVNPNCDL